MASACEGKSPFSLHRSKHFQKSAGPWIFTIFTIFLFRCAFILLSYYSFSVLGTTFCILFSYLFLTYYITKTCKQRFFSPQPKIFRWEISVLRVCDSCYWKEGGSLRVSGRKRLGSTKSRRWFCHGHPVSIGRSCHCNRLFSYRRSCDHVASIRQKSHFAEMPICPSLSAGTPR